MMYFVKIDHLGGRDIIFRNFLEKPIGITYVGNLSI
jgi:hypothetical protein